MDKISLDQLIQDVFTNKELGNKLYKEEKLLEAEDQYKKCVELIDTTVKEIKLEEPQEEKLKEIKKQLVFILSNLAMVTSKLGKYKESSQYDIRIVFKLDKKFEKSYARLVSSYKSLNNSTLSKYFARTMKSFFDEQAVGKYPEVVKVLEDDKMAMEDIFKGTMFSK